jgi:hypothetical protein
LPDDGFAVSLSVTVVDNNGTLIVLDSDDSSGGFVDEIGNTSFVVVDADVSSTTNVVSNPFVDSLRSIVSTVIDSVVEYTIVVVVVEEVLVGISEVIGVVVEMVVVEIEIGKAVVNDIVGSDFIVVVLEIVNVVSG